MTHDDRTNNIYIDIGSKPKVNLNINAKNPVNIDIDKTKGGTSNYDALTNKPQINDVTLIGNKTSKQLGLQDELDMADEHDIDDILYGV